MEKKIESIDPIRTQRKEKSLIQSSMQKYVQVYEQLGFIQRLYTPDIALRGKIYGSNLSMIRTYLMPMVFNDITIRSLLRV